MQSLDLMISAGCRGRRRLVLREQRQMQCQRLEDMLYRSIIVWALQVQRISGHLTGHKYSALAALKETIMIIYRPLACIPFSVCFRCFGRMSLDDRVEG